MWGGIAPPQGGASHRSAPYPRSGGQPENLPLDDLIPGGRVDVILTRRGLDEPWGFDVERAPGNDSILIVKRVFGGSIADSQQLMRGDVITAVNGSDVAYLTYAETLELINQAGTDLSLTVDTQPDQPIVPAQQQYKRETAPRQPQSQQISPQYQKQQLQQQQQLLKQQLLQQKQLQQQKLQQLQQQYQPQLPDDDFEDQQELVDEFGYDGAERQSRSRAVPVRADLLDDVQDYNGQRSSSAGPSSRGRPTVKWAPPPPSNLIEFGWTPKSKPISANSRSVSQGALSEPGWSSRPKPQPKPKAPVPSMTEMGWSPRPTSSQVHASNPALNEMGWAPKVKPKPLSVSTTNVNSIQAQDTQFDVEQYGNLCEGPNLQYSQPEYQPAQPKEEYLDPHFATMPGWFNKLRSSAGSGQVFLDKKAPVGTRASPRNEFGWTPQALNKSANVGQSPPVQSYQSAPRLAPKQPQYGQRSEGEPHWTSYPKKVHRSQAQGMGNEERFVSEIQNIQLCTSGWSASQIQQPQQKQPLASQNLPQAQHIAPSLSAKQVQQVQQMKQTGPTIAPSVQLPYVPTQIAGQTPRLGQPGSQSRQVSQPQQRLQLISGQQIQRPLARQQVGDVQPYQLRGASQVPQQFVPLAGQPYQQNVSLADTTPVQQSAIPQEIGVVSHAAPAAQHFSGQPQTYAAALPQAQIQQAHVPRGLPHTVPQELVPQPAHLQTAAPHATVPAATQRYQEQAIPGQSIAFVDFYVIAESAAPIKGGAPNLASSASVGMAPVGAQLKAGEFCGGFVDFYVIPDRQLEHVKTDQVEKSRVQQAPALLVQQQHATSTDSVGCDKSISGARSAVATTNKAFSGAFVDFYVRPQDTASEAIQKPAASQQAPAQQSSKIRSGGFIDFYVLPEGSSSVVANSLPAADSSKEQVRSGGFVDFYVISEDVKLQTLSKSQQSQIASSPQPASQSQQGVSSQQLSSSKEPSASAPSATSKQVQSSPAINQESNESHGSSKVAASKSGEIATDSKVKGNQTIPEASKTSEQIKNGVPAANENKQATSAKIGNGAPAQAENPGASKVQKLSTPAAFRDQKPTKPFPGKLK